MKQSARFSILLIMVSFFGCDLVINEAGGSYCQQLLTIKKDVSLMNKTWGELYRFVQNIDDYSISSGTGSIYVRDGYHPELEKKFVDLDWSALQIINHDKVVSVKIDVPSVTKINSLNHALKIFRANGYRYIDVGGINHRLRFIPSEVDDSAYKVAVICKRTNSDHSSFYE